MGTQIRQRKQNDIFKHAARCKMLLRTLAPKNKYTFIITRIFLPQRNFYIFSVSFFESENRLYTYYNRYIA